MLSAEALGRAAGPLGMRTECLKTILGLSQICDHLIQMLETILRQEAPTQSQEVYNSSTATLLRKGAVHASCLTIKSGTPIINSFDRIQVRHNKK